MVHFTFRAWSNKYTAAAFFQVTLSVLILGEDKVAWPPFWVAMPPNQCY